MEQENREVIPKIFPVRLFLHLGWIIGFVVIFSIFFVQREATEHYAEALKQGKELGLSLPKEPRLAPEFRLPDLSGKQVSLADQRGKIVFLNFWATWCPPCRAEMPAMERLFQRMQNRDFVMLAIDFQESQQQAQKFMDEFQFTFPVLLDTDGTVGTTYGVMGLPTTYILDREGRIVASVVGPREWDSETAYAFFEHLLNVATIEARLQ